VYANRRRLRRDRGQCLLRRRGEYLERTFPHVYDTGGMRRTHLRGHTNILKRLLIHTGGFNLGLVMRHLTGVGTPRGLQGRVAAVIAALLEPFAEARARVWAIWAWDQAITARRHSLGSPTNLGYQLVSERDLHHGLLDLD
jgi:transposase